MKKYNVIYEADGKTIMKKGISMDELNKFIATIDEEKMKKILNGDSSLQVYAVREEQERWVKKQGENYWAF